ncbi:MAG: hypothetical protein NTW35_02915 [Candidatus Nomurabacteria bacterium]|nr:hypothetical protein [Candidatus Nomurabacteria bacterium]
MTTKRKLLELKHSAEGMRFLRVLEYLRANPDHPLSACINDSFANNRQVVAEMEMFGGGRYRDLPTDMKAFISRCANFKKYHPELTMRRIAREQYLLVKHESDKLYYSILQMLEEHYLRITWPDVQKQMIEEWYAHAAKNPSHSYHPEEMI